MVPIVLADGSPRAFPAYSDVATIGNITEPVTIVALPQGSSLVGMVLLDGKQLTVNAWPGGDVVIRCLPDFASLPYEQATPTHGDETRHVAGRFAPTGMEFLRSEIVSVVVRLAARAGQRELRLGSERDHSVFPVRMQTDAGRRADETGYPGLGQNLGLRFLRRQQVRLFRGILVGLLL